MTDLFHRHAELLSPLSMRLLARVAASEVVQADETSIKMLGTTKRAYIWTFLSENLIAYQGEPQREDAEPRPRRHERHARGRHVHRQPEDADSAAPPPGDAARQ